nr:HupE/UreJ family protein [Sphingomonas koreensis]
MLLFLTGLSLVLWTGTAFAHAVAEGDKGYIQEISGVHLLEFMYLGAKHMVTGYDHILFLFGIIFFLYRMKHIAIYVSLFAIGHSTTMLLGVFFDFGINSYIIDAIIGFSIVYKSYSASSARDWSSRTIPGSRPVGTASIKDAGLAIVSTAGSGAGRRCAVLQRSRAGRPETR